MWTTPAIIETQQVFADKYPYTACLSSCLFLGQNGMTAANRQTTSWLLQHYEGMKPSQLSSDKLIDLH
jgi:hypothetical protein